MLRLPADDTGRNRASAALRGVKVTWFGHATFLMVSPRGLRVVFDPWLTANPACPANLKTIADADVMLITHGHSDHCDDAVRVARATSATVVASPELAAWLEGQGLKHLKPMNIGGRQTISGLSIAMVPSTHSSSAIENGAVTYLGPATGFVVRFEEGPTMYFAGDTGLFGDMRLIGERHLPHLAFLPIGDRFTMGPDDAAMAAEWLGVKAVVPMHYGTFPELTGTPERLRECLAGKSIEVIELRPGETVG